MTRQVSVELLGGFAISIDGRPVDPQHWRRRAPAALVKLLALQPERRLVRDRIVDSLWPDLLLEEAQPRLHKATYYARAALGGGDSLLVDGSGITLLPDADVTVDVAAFEQAADTARTDGGADAARVAAVLYRGDLLPDDLYEPWTDEARGRLRLRWLELLPVAGMYEELVAADPLDEGAHLALVRAHVEAGRRQPALAALDRMTAILHDELGVEPGPAAAELRQRAEALPFPRAGVVIDASRRLPARRAPLIGRDDDLAAVVDLVGRGRIVTVTGPGGAGKSSLAIAAARTASEVVGPDADVVLAELAAARDDGGVTRVVAEAAGIEGRGAVDLDSLASALARRDVLLVLDNCEHLLDPCAALVDAVLDAGPGARVLATSREPLRVDGEAEHRLGSLGSHAAELFVERATAVRAGSVDARDPLVAEVCERLDGLPLAIELAAAQLRHLSLAELVDRLDDRLRLLAGGRPRAGHRHSALEATIDWSYQLLGDGTRPLFDGLGAFPAGFDLDAAVALSDVDAATATNVVGELVAKSLVVFDPQHRRYRLLETVRLFASDRLDDSGRRDEVEERLRGHVVARARSLPRPRAWGSTSLSARSRDDLDNVRWAFEASLARGDVTAALDIAVGLSTLWRNATSYAEGQRWVAALAAVAVDPRDRAWTELLGADVGLGAGDIREMRAHADAAVGLAEDADDPAAAVIAAIYQAMVHLATPARAVERLEAAAAQAEEVGEEALARLARAYRLVARLLLGSLDGLRDDARAVTEGVATADYALYLSRWAASLVAVVERDGAWQDDLMTHQLEELESSTLRGNWLTLYWDALRLIGIGEEFRPQLLRARARAEAEGRGAEPDLVLALAHVAAGRDEWEEAALLVGATEGALLHDTAGFLQQVIVRDRLVRPHLDPDVFDRQLARGRDLVLSDVLARHGL